MLESNCYEPLETTEEMTATNKAQTLEENKAAKNIATMFHESLLLGERLLNRTHAQLVGLSLNSHLNKLNTTD